MSIHNYKKGDLVYYHEEAYSHIWKKKTSCLIGFESCPSYVFAEDRQVRIPKGSIGIIIECPALFENYYTFFKEPFWRTRQRSLEDLVEADNLSIGLVILVDNKMFGVVRKYLDDYIIPLELKENGD